MRSNHLAVAAVALGAGLLGTSAAHVRAIADGLPQPAKAPVTAPAPAPSQPVLERAPCHRHHHTGEAV